MISKSLPFALIILITSCTSDYEVEQIQADNRNYILSYLTLGEQLVVQYDNIKKTNIDTTSNNGRAQLLLLEDGVLFDTLRYQKVKIDTFGGVFFERLYYPRYVSSSLLKYPKSNHTYTLRIIDAGVEKLYSYGAIPNPPLVDSIVFYPEKYALTFNYYADGAIYLNQADKTNYVGFVGEHTLIRDKGFSSVQSKEQVAYQLSTFNYCGKIVDYIQAPFYLSATTSCLDPNKKIISFFDPNFPISDTLITSKMKVCTIREDLANMTSSIPLYFEGTEFFFAPSNKVKFAINDDKHLGLLSCLTCTTIDVKLNR